MKTPLRRWTHLKHSRLTLDQHLQTPPFCHLTNKKSAYSHVVPGTPPPQPLPPVRLRPVFWNTRMTTGDFTWQRVEPILKKDGHNQTSGHVTHLSSSCVHLCRPCCSRASSAGANSEVLPLPSGTVGRGPSEARPRGRERPPLDRRGLCPCPRHLRHCRRSSHRRSLKRPRQRSRSLTLEQQQPGWIKADQDY